MRAFFKKADIVLLVVLVLIGAGSAFLVHFFSGASETVEIMVNGDLYGSYDLHTDRTVEINTEFGRNIVSIADGMVSVTESDCIGRDCIAFGKIGTAGQVIMCMPHRLIVTVTDRSPGAGQEQPDAVVY